MPREAIRGFKLNQVNEYGPTKCKAQPMANRVLKSARLFCLFSGVLLGLAWFSPAKADQQVFRCVVNGKTTYTDKPCDAPTPGRPAGGNGGSGKFIALDYATPYGVWRGKAQYQVTVNGQPVREAHVVVPLVIEIEKQGGVRGASPENGCKLLGVAAPYLAPNMLTLDVTLSECRYPAFNRRYSGQLILSETRNSVQVSLRSSNDMVAVLMKGPATFDIKATMQR